MKHLRLAKVKTLQDANKFLEAEYWPEWNELLRASAGKAWWTCIVR